MGELDGEALLLRIGTVEQRPTMMFIGRDENACLYASRHFLTLCFGMQI
ncbi:hypothetical protein O9Z70_11275 [Devosia sp. YIM 151766]|nr:hypothetical protein [Devosia sp. YIM 151766]WIY52059.1 hypothetical protein O9Z70_11275 [Devosia sp. YIM 151766]